VNFYKNLQPSRTGESDRFRKACHPAQLALAWLLAQGDDIACDSETKQRNYLEENSTRDCTDPQRELSQIEAGLRPGIVAGSRYMSSK